MCAAIPESNSSHQFVEVGMGRRNVKEGPVVQSCCSECSVISVSPLPMALRKGMLMADLPNLLTRWKMYIAEAFNPNERTYSWTSFTTASPS